RRGDLDRRVRGLRRAADGRRRVARHDAHRGELVARHPVPRLHPHCTHAHGRHSPINRSTIDLWVGAFVVAGVAGLLFLALKVGNLATFSTAQTYLVNAKFANIGGLKVRGPVKSAGVVVGRVADIRFDNESYEAIVTMNIDSSYQFPRDTTAKILTSGILGEQYVGLEAGGDGVMLKNGDRLRLTQSAVVLENLISQFLFNKAAEGNPEAKADRAK